MSAEETAFGPIRSFLWPIYRHEVRKIVPMMLILFLICFNYTVLRNLKDAVVVTAQSSGAEVIPFIKVWVLLPSAILMALLYTRMCSRFGQEKVFYILISGFLLFFALFTFVLYPQRDSLHPHEFADRLSALLPAGFKGLIAMLRNWTFTMFYVGCELWSSIVFTVLTWGFVNQVTKITEARRFYSMLGVVASLSGSIAGVVANALSAGHTWEATLDVLVTAVIIAGCLGMLIFRWMNKYVLNAPSYDEFHQTAKEMRKKNKLSLRESFAHLSGSKYLVCIAAMVVSYNLVINLVEIVWKDQLLQLYPSPLEYNTYMNSITSVMGLISASISLLMPRLIGRFGWTRTALITPVSMMITSIGFFSFMLFRNDLSEPVLTLLGTTPLAIAVFFGAAQICLSRACKYSIFDSTKEMAFIPLPHDLKVKGKAAIDGVGSRLGKSGGSIVHQSLLMVFSTVSGSAPYVAAVLLAVISGWVVATRALGVQFAALIGREGRKDVGEESAEKQVVKPQSVKI